MVAFPVQVAGRVIKGAATSRTRSAGAAVVSAAKTARRSEFTVVKCIVTFLFSQIYV